MTPTRPASQPYRSKRSKAGSTPGATFWIVVVALNILLSAGVGVGSYYYTASRADADIAAEEMADDEAEGDEEEIPDTDDPNFSVAARGSGGAVAVATTPSKTAAPATKVSPMSQAMADCDEAAADPDDPDRALDPDGVRTTGLASNQIDIRKALASCGAAPVTASMSLEQLRMQYQRGRANFQSGRYEEAIPAFLALCNANYGIACLRLAEAARSGIGGVNQDDTIAYAYAQKAARENVAAAGELMMTLGPQVSPWTRTQARALVEPLFLGKFDAIPDTVSTRRYFVTLFLQSEKQNAAWYTGMMSNQDHLHARQTIWPVLETRLGLSVDEGKKVYSNLVDRVKGTEDLRSALSTAANSVMELRTIAQNANSVQVALGARDAQQLFEWFSGCGACSARQTYAVNLGQLMKRWSGTKPAPDNDKTCALLYRQPPKNCLPLDDYEGSEGGKALDVVSKPGGR